MRYLVSALKQYLYKHDVLTLVHCTEDISVHERYGEVEYFCGYGVIDISFIHGRRYAYYIFECKEKGFKWILEFDLLSAERSAALLLGVKQNCFDKLLVSLRS